MENVNRMIEIGVNSEIEGDVQFEIFQQNIVTKEKVHQLWFHTAFVDDNVITFRRDDLDDFMGEAQEPLIPQNFRIQLHFKPQKRTPESSRTKTSEKLSDREASVPLMSQYTSPIETEPKTQLRYSPKNPQSTNTNTPLLEEKNSPLRNLPENTFNPFLPSTIVSSPVAPLLQKGVDIKSVLDKTSQFLTTKPKKSTMDGLDDRLMKLISESRQKLSSKFGGPDIGNLVKQELNEPTKSQNPFMITSNTTTSQSSQLSNLHNFFFDEEPVFQGVTQPVVSSDNHHTPEKPPTTENRSSLLSMSQLENNTIVVNRSPKTKVPPSNTPEDLLDKVLVSNGTLIIMSLIAQSSSHVNIRVHFSDNTKLPYKIIVSHATSLKSKWIPLSVHYTNFMKDVTFPLVRLEIDKSFHVGKYLSLSFYPMDASDTFVVHIIKVYGLINS